MVASCCIGQINEGFSRELLLLFLPDKNVCSVEFKSRTYCCMQQLGFCCVDAHLCGSLEIEGRRRE